MLELRRGIMTTKDTKIGMEGDEQREDELGEGVLLDPDTMQARTITRVSRNDC